MLKLRRRSISREIQTIRRSLSSIVRALVRLTPALEAAVANGPVHQQRRQRRLRLSPGRRAALKLQGQYIGHLRSLKPRQKARVKALRADKGVRAAISFARRLAKR
jgi:hypothetical protein